METYLYLVGPAVILSLSLLALANSLLYRHKVKTQYDSLIIDYQPIDRLRKEVSELARTYSQPQEDYTSKRSLLQKYERIIDSYDLGVGSIDSSPYQPLHDKGGLLVLESNLDHIKDQTKTFIREKRACISKLPTDLALNGKKGAAKTFVNREIKLRIRCLDNEVKAAIASVQWNNINRLIERVRNKFAEINEDSQMVKIFLEDEYLELKVLELRLNFEIKQLKADIKEEEREERQRIREEQRDEERVKIELERAERERLRMEKLVENELAKIANATDAQKAKLVLHQKELELLREKELRAKSLAQQTRAGYVYVISNHTAFGEGVCKIGMTRRLDPNDRVKELGDASVPDVFKVHAFIYTEDAPTLEKYFHDQFRHRRVNLVNQRKEFFQLSPSDALLELENYQGHYVLEATG